MKNMIAVFGTCSLLSFAMRFNNPLRRLSRMRGENYNSVAFFSKLCHLLLHASDRWFAKQSFLLKTVDVLETQCTFGISSDLQSDNSHRSELLGDVDHLFLKLHAMFAKSDSLQKRLLITYIYFLISHRCIQGEHSSRITFRNHLQTVDMQYNRLNVLERRALESSIDSNRILICIKTLAIM